MSFEGNFIMNGALLLIGACVLFYLAYRFYGGLIERVFGFDFSRPTPAHTLKDGMDYVPARPVVVFAHHFTSIAGAGPIVGPIFAAQFGWVPVVLWVVLGCILIGSMHDMAAMFLSIRHQGRSIGTVIETLMGYWGRMLFLFFCWFTLILVTAEFTRLVAEMFLKMPAVATASLLFIALALCFGSLVYKGAVKLLPASLIFVPLTFACVYWGTLIPIDMVRLMDGNVAVARQIWVFVLLAYCFAASTLPVWLLLQPRDYLNSYLLYALMALGFVGILVAMPVIHLDAFTGWRVTNAAGGSDPLIPLLFVTVACGACSGFHALVASGTTAKQVASERHLRPVAYGSMLVEGVLAVIALITICFLSQAEYSMKLKEGIPPTMLFTQGLVTFTDKLGLPHHACEVFIALALSAFLMTTIDTATRLARFTWQELFLPRVKPEQDISVAPAKSPAITFLTNRYVATSLAVFASGWLLLGGGAKSIWPIFASSNQLLAALTLLGCSLWLLRHKRPVFIAFIPMLFMMLTSGSAIVTLFLRNLNAWQTGGFQAGGVMTLTTGILIGMSVALIAMGAVSILKAVRGR
jgi:carbon starvation protein